MAGKGSKRRPSFISLEEQQRRWEAVFGNKGKPCEQTTEIKPNAGTGQPVGEEREQGS